MKTWIMLMRGINVGGKNLLPMKTLRQLIEDVGGENVATYIQSGNAVFRHTETDAPELAQQVRNSVGAACGFEPQVLLLGAEDLERAIRGNPFAAETADPKSLHLWFLSQSAERANIDGMNALRSASERFELIDTVFYLHAPDGIGRSKLAARVERLLGVDATARNWRTTNKVFEMARNLDDGS